MSYQELLEKWDPILNNDRVEGISDDYRRKVTAQLLENQQKFLAEAATSVEGNIDKWDPILISLVRRMAPKLIAYDVCGVQPMTGPTGLIFAMRAKYATGSYQNKDGTSEALFDEANTVWSGGGTHSGSDPFSPSGKVVDITITEAGDGYGEAPAVTFSGGGGSGAAATAVLGSGANADKVIAIVITNRGSGYTSAPTIAIAAPGGAAPLVNATATCTIGSAQSTGAGVATATAEADTTWNAMSMTIEKASVTATTRQLRADYSLELAQDLRALHGLDAESELTNILSAEIIAEINREVIRKIYLAAKQGSQFSSTAGIFDLQNDADGRWSVERFKGLMFAIERDANAIATESRRGKGNIIITSADVASALVMAGLLQYNPDMMKQTNVDVDASGATYAGTMGRFKVFVDPYLSVDGYVVGYKGANAYDAGMFYCPYVPLQLVRATAVDTFQPAIGFKTRYGLIANPFTSLSSGSNVYYRKTRVLNLL